MATKSLQQPIKKPDYKLGQKEARLAYKFAKHGTRVIKCEKPGCISFRLPLLKMPNGEYRHERCK